MIVPTDLARVRGEIEDLDREIVERLVKRAALSRNAHEIKRRHGLPQIDQDRERMLRLVWSEQAGRTLGEVGFRGDDMAMRRGFWTDLGAVFDCVLDFCTRAAGRSAR